MSTTDSEDDRPTEAEVVAAMYRARYPMGDPRLSLIGKAVHHLDGDPRNLDLDNLRVVDLRENVQGQ